MKRLKDYSWQELVALTDDQIDTLTEIETACANIPIVLKPEPVKTKEAILQKREGYYKVYGILVTREEDARKIASIMAFKEDYDYGCGYDYRYASKLSNDIEMITLYNKDEIITSKVPLLNYVDDKNRFDGEQSEYLKYMEKVNEVKSNILTAIRDARKKQSIFNNIKAKYDRFMELTNGDKKVSLTLLRDAFANYEDLFNDFCNMNKDLATEEVADEEVADE